MRLLLLAGWLFLLGSGLLAKQREPANIVLILADDLGYGELGCYGQRKIRTPRIDRLAGQGLRFTQAYSGAPVCAPARCVLMTGRHSANAEIRGNREVKPEGQLPLSEQSVTLPALLKAKGYATGAIGKWGLGPVGSSGDPNAKGFDLFFGYNCQREAHSYYPDHLWRNRERVELDNGKIPGHARLDVAPENYDRFRGREYAPDLMMREAERFLRERRERRERREHREHRERPFFLYLPFVEPHLAMQPPGEWVERYPEDWDDAPYLGQRGYLPHPRPRAGYAAMISDLDEHVGRIVDLIDELDLGENTLILFTSDNGATHDVGGVDTEFFQSVGPLRGRKGSVYEGGLRVPLIARWTGVIEPDTTSDHVCAFWDLMPTFADLAGAPAPAQCDGQSFLPALTGRGEQPIHEYLVWEFHGYGGQKAVRLGDWKGVLRDIHKGGEQIELYNLKDDLGEAHDVAAEHPEIVERIARIFATDRTPNEQFPMERFDPS